MKIVILNDTHFGVRQDNLALMHWQVKFFQQTFLPYLEAHRADIAGIVHLGDMFDRRTQTNHQTLMQFKDVFFDPIKATGLPFWWILGNHDIYYKNSLGVNASSLLTGYPITVISQPTDVKIDKKSYFMLPWICPENLETSMHAIKTTKSRVCFGHLEMSGFDLGGGIVSSSGIPADRMEKFDLVVSGHYHRRSRKNNVLYCGTQYQMTWADYGVDKGFHVLDTATGEVDFIQNTDAVFGVLNYPDLPDPQEMSSLESMFIKIIVDKVDSRGKLETYIHEVESHNPFDLKVIERENTPEAEQAVTDALENVKPTVQIILEAVPEYCATANTEVSALVSSRIKDLYEVSKESIS